MGDINKRKERIVFRPDIFFWGEGNRIASILQAASSFYGERERNHVTDYFIGIDQTIPDWLVKITFLGGAKMPFS